MARKKKGKSESQLLSAKTLTGLSEGVLKPLLSSAAKLRDIRMVFSEASNSFDSPRIQFTHFDLGFEVNVNRQPIKNGERSAVQIKATLGLTGRETKESPSDQSIQIKATYLLTYHAGNSLQNDEVLAEFVKWVAINDAWPYFREFVQSTGGRMGFPNLRIPTYSPETEPFSSLDLRESTKGGSQGEKAKATKKKKATSRSSRSKKKKKPTSKKR